MLVLTLVVGMVPLLPLQVEAAEATSGTCGDNLTWNLDENGTLTISGSGKMKDYRYSSLSSYYDNPAPWYSQRDSIKKISISHLVTSIGEYAFYNCTNLTDFSVPNSITSIGSYAFSSCQNLKSVYIDDISSFCSIRFIGYSSNPLSNGANLYVDNNLVKHLEIPSSVTSIGHSAFEGCTSLTSVSIPSSVTSIGSWAFHGCSSLSSVSISNSVTSIGDSAFSSCINLSNILIPNSVSYIGYAAFSNCTNLSSINIPNSVTSIGQHAFEYCCNLKSAYIDNIANFCSIRFGYFDSNPLYYGANLYLNNDLVEGYLKIPNSVASIGDYAFYNYDKLTSISIPNSITSIGSSAFSSCQNLKSVYIDDISNFCSIHFISYGSNPLSNGADLYIGNNLVEHLEIPNSVTSIGHFAFQGCSSLSSVNIPSSVTSIGRYAFQGCSNLSSVSIPNSVTSISERTFSQCTSLPNILIPNSVNDIGYEAFVGCTSLYSINIPNSVTSIGQHAFEYCRNLKSIYIDNIGNFCSIRFDYFDSNPLYYGANLYLNNDLVEGHLEIPDSITSIGAYAFHGYDKLTSISIPSSITSIGKSAFIYCKNLKSVYIDDISSFCSINFSEYGANPMCNGASLYLNNSLVEHLEIPSSVTSIKNYTFQGCSSLSIVNIPSSVTSIGRYAFAGCSNLSNVILPNSITSIGYNAFSSCTSLSTITIPSSVSTIESEAFSSCSKLSSVFFDGDTPSVTEASSIYYHSFPLDTTLYYIPGKSGWTSPTWKGYKTAAWNGYAASSITPMDFGKIEINYAGEGYAHFMVTDSSGEALPGARVRCLLSGKTLKEPVKSELVSDGNGIISVKTPTVTSDTEFTATFSFVDDAGQFSGLEQNIKVSVKKLSYEQSWEGKLTSSVDVGLSAGASGSIGKAKIEASLLKGMVGEDKSSTLTVKESFENGTRNLELTTEREDLLSLGVKSGVDANVGDSKISLVGASVGVTGGRSEAVGLKIKDYDPEKNPEQLLSMGKYWLMASLLRNPTSIFCSRMLARLNEDFAVGNQYNAVNKVSAKGDLSAFSVKIGKERGPVVEGALAGVDGYALFSWSKDFDNLDKESVFTRSAITSLEGGLFKSLKVGVQDKSNKGPEAHASGSGGDYILGGSLSNHKEISAKQDTSSKEVKELSYKTYDGVESDLSWFHESTDTYSTVKYSGDAAQNLINENEKLKRFAEGSYLSIGIQNAIDIMSSSNQLAQVNETEKVKKGIDADISFGFSLGVSLDGGIGVSGENSYSYDKGNSVIYQGTVYPTSTSSDSIKKEINSQKSKLADLVLEPVHAAWQSCKNMFDSVWKSIKDGVKNAYATVSGAVSDGVDWVIGLTRGQDNDNKNSIQSYAILSLEDEGTPNSDAALSVTLGDPYLVEVYTDESQETLVTDEQLAASPLTLTLEYTDEMLKAAGATAETEVKIYHYDAERNVYVCLPESKQDREAKSVTAQITQQGEYVLAVDTAAPCVSDFKPSDGTAKPTLTALVSDLSGLKDFSFWIDNGDALVTKENLKDYYVEKTGVFTYAVTEDLSVGEHTAYFMAEDTLGNRLTEPVSFTFTVQDFSVVLPAPAVPAETVRDGCFTVTTPAPTDGSVEGMTLVLETEDGRLVSIPMTLENDTWTAEVTDLSGSGTLKVYTIAADAYGNTVESKEQEVKVEEDKEEVAVTSLALGDLLSLDGKAGVKVNVTNGEEGAISALLNVAFYDEKGKQLDVVQTGVGLTGHETQTYTVGSSVSSNQVAKIKAFLLDCADGYTPLCTPVGK